jgi:hypothetical protein
VVPSFQQQYGPIREVRFIYQVDSSGNFVLDGNGNRIPDGGVHQLWVVKGIQGDPTIPGCALAQPDFEKQVRQKNVAFRIPLQMLGLGLIDSIQDREILARQAATASDRASLGIGGKPNRSGNDGTITRFGWKAQNKSITIFAGEAYNVEMGITNELFPHSKEEDPGCNGPNKPGPNDVTRMDTSDEVNQAFNNPLHIMADWMQFQLLMRFTDAPQPDPKPSNSAVKGRALFSAVGCALCHTPTMQTAPVMNSAVLQNRPVNLYSDLLVHDMGTGLADGVTQGAAGPREFRSTPLWGVGQRIFFLHDGRTDDLLEGNSRASVGGLGSQRRDRQVRDPVGAGQAGHSRLPPFALISTGADGCHDCRRVPTAAARCLRLPRRYAAHPCRGCRKRPRTQGPWLTMPAMPQRPDAPTRLNRAGTRCGRFRSTACRRPVSARFFPPRADGRRR